MRRYTAGHGIRAAACFRCHVQECSIAHIIGLFRLDYDESLLRLKGTAPELDKGSRRRPHHTAACGFYNPLLRLPSASHTALQPGLPRRSGGLPAMAAHPAADSHFCQHHIRPSAAGGAAGGGAGGGRSVDRGDWAAFFGLLFFRWNFVRQIRPLAAERRMGTWPLCSAHSMIADLHVPHPAVGCLHSQARRGGTGGEPAAGSPRAAHGPPQGAFCMQTVGLHVWARS